MRRKQGMMTTTQPMQRTPLTDLTLGDVIDVTWLVLAGRRAESISTASTGRRWERVILLATRRGGVQGIRTF